jgi:hypothetical protein
MFRGNWRTDARPHNVTFPLESDGVARRTFATQCKEAFVELALDPCQPLTFIGSQAAVRVRGMEQRCAIRREARDCPLQSPHAEPVILERRRAH